MFKTYFMVFILFFSAFAAAPQVSGNSAVMADGYPPTSKGG